MLIAFVIRCGKLFTIGDDMDADYLKSQIIMANNIAMQGMKSGMDVGFREGMLRAAAMCEAKAKMHQEYLRPGQQHKTTGDLDDAATCGRRDECTNLAYEIREAAGVAA